ncbi:MAG: hypothetical protein AAF438_19435 [Pseudomonadota bacterium]
MDNWIFMSLFAASAWALSCVLDVCFVSKGIYKTPWDGPTIAGLFCLLPVVFLWDGVNFSGPTGVYLVGIGSGFAFLAHVYYYFKALFAVNDAVNIEIANNLCVLLVPLLAFLFLGERLDILHYMSIGVGALAILVLTGSQTARLPPRVLFYLGVSVFSISMMMVMQAWVLKHVNYATAVWLFSFAAFMIVATSLVVKRQRAARLGTMIQKFGWIFVGVQLLELSGTLGSQRATDIGPSVSLVALVECSVPVFVMLFSWIITEAIQRTTSWNSPSLVSALSSQISYAPSKLTALMLILFAISAAPFGPG